MNIEVSLYFCLPFDKQVVLANHNRFIDNGKALSHHNHNMIDIKRLAIHDRTVALILA